MKNKKYWILFCLVITMFLVTGCSYIFTQSINNSIAEQQEELEKREAASEFRGDSAVLIKDLETELTNVVYSDTMHGSNTTKMEISENISVEDYYKDRIDDEYIYIIEEYTYFDKETSSSSSKKTKKRNGKRYRTNDTHTSTSYSLETNTTVYFKADTITFGKYEIDLSDLSTTDMIRIYSKETGDYDDHSLKRTTYYGIAENQLLTILTDIKDHELVNTEFYQQDSLLYGVSEIVAEVTNQAQAEQDKNVTEKILSCANTEHLTIDDLTYANIQTVSELLEDGWQFSYDAGVETKEEFDSKLLEYSRESSGTYSSSTNMYRNDFQIFVHMQFTDANNLDNAKVTSITIYPSLCNDASDFTTPQGYGKDTTIDVLENTYLQKGGVKKVESYGIYYNFESENMTASFSTSKSETMVGHITITFK